MHILFVCGYAGSGKDTLADLFVPHGYKKYAFAEPVKTFTAIKHGFPVALTYTQEGKSTIVLSKERHTELTVRQLLIEESLDAKLKSNDPAFWARIVAEKIKDDELVIISDWRYLAEFVHVKTSFPDAVLTSIRVVRESVTPLDEPSEHDLDNVSVDHTILNEGPITSLYPFVSSIINYK